eukprot:CAMPEP_0168219178 /NCGR_PEP_ID=MMETSP0140_2-20121125/8389_1 /TAXON_ID=44445 /ORGANISM="Pseudo-nitzschia australis, Strain 10249 10 AB" /LENGTH=72 /DNA_ID=CAMNT_0008147477 /DNA_START=20 /DNA_END=235 /DNA_ORIENTATION=+
MASFPIVFIVTPKGGNPSASSETAPSVVVRQASWRATNELDGQMASGAAVVLFGLLAEASPPSASAPPTPVS